MLRRDFADFAKVAMQPSGYMTSSVMPKKGTAAGGVGECEVLPFSTFEYVVKQRIRELCLATQKPWFPTVSPSMFSGG